MQAKLKSIASIQMGYSFRSRLERDPKGNVSVIQMKDLTEDNRLNNQGLVLIEMADLKEHHRVKPHDLVFRSRGQTNTVALVDSDCKAAVIAAPLLRIRADKKLVLPAYLCWFINQPTSQALLQSKATGTAMRMIGKPTLEELDILLPSLNIQERIVALEKLSHEEQRLMRELTTKKRRLMGGFLMTLASTIQ
jgi:restriction endonuclease S subunit